jgi:GT2 family glycosyltransferase
MKNKFAIGIPTLNRADLLIPSLEAYAKDFDGIKIYIVDNGNQIELFNWLNQVDNPNHEVVFPSENLGVAKSWNTLLDSIYKEHEYALILNDDIYLGLHKNYIENLIERYQSQVLLTNPIDWCVFLMPKSTYIEHGKFDEQFYPAYCEDNDYVYRLKLKGQKVFKTPDLIPKVHRASMTLERDYTLQTAYHENKEKYIEKWGGAPDFELFKKPYNN